MTSYSTERPTLRRSTRPALAHLRPGQATTGQPVTIRTLDADGNEVEFPAVYVRRADNGLHLMCAKADESQTQRYRPSQVFPRRETYRKWIVTLKPNGPAGDELLPVNVLARTELEARYEALKQIRARFGSRPLFRLHSVKRAG